MRNDYGSLRRRTRDSSWQWMIMGMILGMGFALVVCVGGYALGGITFPALEEDTSTPGVQILPNETEVAMQAAAAQQTLDAIRALTNTAAAPEQTNETTRAADADTTPAETPMQSTPTASPLPNNNTPSTQAADAAGGQVQTDTQALPASPQESAAAIAQDTPVLGTPPVGAPTPTISFASGPIIPPELDAIKTELVPVTGGTFLMGTTLEEASQARDECALYGKECNIEWASDSIPTHQVTVDSFQMEVYEVSVAQYVAFLNWKGPNSHKTMCQGQPCALTVDDQQNSYIQFDGTTYSIRNPDFYSNHPVTLVTWWGAQEYCSTLNRRLPTEAEWERAARGSQNYIYPWGFTFDTAKASTAITEPKGTYPITDFATGASPYGVYNLAGNVEEWVFDWYQSDYYSQQVNNPSPNPQGPPSGTEKVLRGGSWDTIPFFVRSVHRRSAAPNEPLTSIGFRCVADATADTPAPAAPSGNTTDQGSGGAAAPGGAPTIAPAPTTAPPAGPAPTLDPG